ncbi:hypothetical protein IFM89_016419 [Coptis chinensis]|uniref:eIF3h C-terminal domain-containing protein n=1 Tax=Coptis chinensis TaxID=261450 RepID=A0A835LIX6_9MAGN|nr:hypothetical protein IFM89_016419 [Coptis chinensis]
MKNEGKGTLQKSGGQMQSEVIDVVAQKHHQIKVSNSALINAFMTELEADTPVTQCDYDRLQLSTNPFMERNVEFLIKCMDDLSMEQQKENLRLKQKVKRTRRRDATSITIFPVS